MTSLIAFLDGMFLSVVKVGSVTTLTADNALPRQDHFKICDSSFSHPPDAQGDQGPCSIWGGACYLHHPFL